MKTVKFVGLLDICSSKAYDYPRKEDNLPSKDLKETEVLRLALASQKNDRDLVKKILAENPNRLLLKGALGVILTMIYEQTDDDNSPEDILDRMLLDYTHTNMKTENG